MRDKLFSRGRGCVLGQYLAQSIRVFGYLWSQNSSVVSNLTVKEVLLAISVEQIEFMDALAAAYATESDDDKEDLLDPIEFKQCLPKDENLQAAARPNDEAGLPEMGKFIGPQLPPAETRRLISPQNPRVALLPAVCNPLAGRPVMPAVGRYVSKRERAEAASCFMATATPTPVDPSPVVGTVINADVPLHLQKRLKRFEEGGIRSQLPKGLLVRLEGHTKAVNAVRWSPTHASLLASAGMDHVAHIWNVWSERKQQNARTLSSHTAAIKDIQWSLDGCSVLTCSFDQTSRLTDVETGCEKQIFKEDQYVNVVKFSPSESELFLSGGSKGVLRLWDIRAGKIVQEYLKGLGQVMDVDFSSDGKQFVTTSDIANRNASDKTIVVWDFKSQIPLSNQVYLEAYTCPCVRYHPYDNVFVAQSNANYIAIFSGYPPFRMNKYKRFEGHQVSGYRVQCNFSQDGELLVSGSADGRVYIYHYKSSKILKMQEAHTHVCTDVSYHPRMSSVIASCGWEGNVCVFE